MPGRGRGRGRGRSGRGRAPGRKRGGYSHTEITKITDNQYIGKVLRNLGNSRYELFTIIGKIQAQFRKGFPIRKGFVMVEDTGLGNSQYQIIALLDDHEVESFRDTPHLPDHVFVGTEKEGEDGDILGIDVAEAIVVGKDNNDEKEKDDDLDIAMLIDNLGDDDFM